MDNLAIEIKGTPIPLPSNIPQGADIVNRIINTTLNLLIFIGVVGSLIFLLYSGILWITSGGEKEKLEAARKSVTYSIVGLVIIVLSFLIIRTLGLLFDIPYLRNFGTSGIPLNLP